MMVSQYYDYSYYTSHLKCLSKKQLFFKVNIISLICNQHIEYLESVVNDFVQLK